MVDDAKAQLSLGGTSELGSMHRQFVNGGRGVEDIKRTGISPTVTPAVRSRLRTCLVSAESRRTTGGLPSYARALARSLQPECEISTVAQFDRPLPGVLDYAGSDSSDTAVVIDGIPTQLVRPVRASRCLLRRLSHLTGRTGLRGLATAVFSAAYGRAMNQAVPDEVDVVHYIGTGWELLGFSALQIARKRGAAFTVWPAVHPGTWGDSALDLDLYNRADAVFCQSDHEMEHLAAKCVARQRLVRAWLAPAAEPTGDGKRFRARHQLGERPLVLFIARKMRSKGFHTLCEAMPAVLVAVPDVCLVAVGPDGEPPYPTVPAHAYLNLGVASEEEKAHALAACDVYCMPSAAESFGIVYVEAWSYGKPVIGGPAPAVRELLGAGEAGLAVDQNAQAVAIAIVRTLSDLALRNRISRRGRELVCEKYNWNCVRDLHLRIFEELKRRRAGGSKRSLDILNGL